MIEFYIPGLPAPGGSKKGFFNPKLKRVMIVEAAGDRNKNWRASVVHGASAAMAGIPAFEGPVELHIKFIMPRPKGHYRTGKNASELRDNAPSYHTSAPDSTKLLRSTEDALSDAGVWRNDSQVARSVVTKVYGDRPGAQIRIEALT